MKETFAIYKISILYMLSQVDIPITTNRLSFFLLKDDYTDYFTFKQVLGELENDGYISSSCLHRKTLYSITEEGSKALSLLINEISDEMKKDIDLYIRENKFSMRNDKTVHSRYFQHGVNDYVSNLVIEENGRNILEINLNSSSEAAAKKVCSNWDSASEDIYPQLIALLLK